MLYDDILLIIFHHYLDASPQFWPTLACVCQTWRQIVLASPLSLNLRLYFTHRTPVFESLECWPVLPIVLQYGGLPNLDPPASEDDDNIIAALKLSGRVSCISLTVTSSLLEKLSVISDPFSELEELALLSLYHCFPTFRWGSRLRSLRLTKIVFPSFPQLLSPCKDLVDLELHEIPSSGYFSLEAFANALSRMTQLRSLSFHFLSPPPGQNHFSFPLSPGDYILLPSLTCLNHRGYSKDLENFVARIDAPRLEDIDITFFSLSTLDVSQLGQFIQRTEVQKSLRQADVETAQDFISISLINSGTSRRFRLQILCTAAFLHRPLYSRTR